MIRRVCRGVHVHACVIEAMLNLRDDALENAPLNFKDKTEGCMILLMIKDMSSDCSDVVSELLPLTLEDQA